MHEERVAKLARLMEVKRLTRTCPYPALNELDRKLEKYLDYENGFFIECGANNGHLQSNTFHLEYFKNWTGILVEPIPHLAKFCAYCRMNAAVYNCALVSHEFEDETLAIRFAGLKSIAQGVKPKNVEDRWVSSGIKNENLEEIGTFTVHAPTNTLTSILDTEKPKAIDLFSLDVEGYEPEVLKGLDMERFRPKYILIEAHDAEAIDALLAPHYDLEAELTEGWDLLYKARHPICRPA